MEDDTEKPRRMIGEHEEQAAEEDMEDMEGQRNMEDEANM